jgi:hypothetical protein
MKRFAFATLAALAALVASEQQAKAWFNLGLGVSSNFNVSWGGHQRCGSRSEPWPEHNPGVPNFNWYGPAPCYGPGGYGYGAPGNGAPGYGAPGNGYVPPMPTPGSGSGSAGSGSPMSFAPSYGYDLQSAYFQAPPYWYGR